MTAHLDEGEDFAEAAEDAREHYLEDRSIARETRTRILSTLLLAGFGLLAALQFAQDESTTLQQGLIFVLTVFAGIVALHHANKRHARSMKYACRASVLSHKAKRGAPIPFTRLVDRVEDRTRVTTGEAEYAVASYLEDDDRARLRPTTTPGSADIDLPPRSAWVDKILKRRQNLAQAARVFDGGEIKRHLAFDEATLTAVFEVIITGGIVAFGAIMGGYAIQSTLSDYFLSQQVEGASPSATVIGIVAYAALLLLMSLTFIRFSVGRLLRKEPDAYKTDDGPARAELTWARGASIVQIFSGAAGVIFTFFALPLYDSDLLIKTTAVFVIAAYVAAAARERLGKRITWTRLAAAAQDGKAIAMDELTREIAHATRLPKEMAKIIAINALREKHKAFGIVIELAPKADAAPPAEKPPLTIDIAQGTALQAHPTHEVRAGLDASSPR